MKKSLFVAAGIAFLTAFSSVCSANTSLNYLKPLSWEFTQQDYNPETLYDEMNLEGVIDYTAFKRGVEGFKKINPDRKDVLTLIDFTKSSKEERCFVLDLRNKKLLYKSVVAHGRNSGQEFATSFSNKYGSYKSSPGFYRTGSTYKGRNGYSLVLEGLEKGINDNARKRAIVVHGSKFVNNRIASLRGQVGRSLGCPALPYEISSKVIDTIKEGTLFYIHSDNPMYVNNTTVVTDETNYYPLASIRSQDYWWSTQFPGVDLA